jgi:hypothetical protein
MGKLFFAAPLMDFTGRSVLVQDIGFEEIIPQGNAPIAKASITELTNEASIDAFLIPYLLCGFLIYRR